MNKQRALLIFPPQSNCYLEVVAGITPPGTAYDVEKIRWRTRSGDYLVAELPEALIEEHAPGNGSPFFRFLATNSQSNLLTKLDRLTLNGSTCAYRLIDVADFVEDAVPI